MSGQLSLPSLSVTGSNDWLIGTPNGAGNIVLQHPNACVTTRDGFDVHLNPGGAGQVVADANMRVNGYVYLASSQGEGGELRFAPHATEPMAILDVYGEWLRIWSVDYWGSVRVVAMWSLYNRPVVGSVEYVNSVPVIPASLKQSITNAVDYETEVLQSRVVQLEQLVTSLSNQVEQLMQQ